MPLEKEGTASRRLPGAVRRAFDIFALVVLGLTSYLVRRGSLPFDGLWFDDSWVAAGAIHGHVTSLMTDGSAHPAFTGLLMATNRLGSGELRDLGVPSLAAGVAGAMVLYIALRSVGYERAISALVSAALVVAPVHILYSGRVKGYTLDVIWVLVLAIAVPRLARMTWRWPLAVGWVVAAIVLGAFSGYLLVATAAAALILALHPAGDRMVRFAAVAVQGAVQLAYYLVAQSKTDLAGIEEVMETAFDGHMTFFWNPIDLARELSRHVGRVAEVYPGGSGGWLTALVFLAICGLVAAAIRGRTREESVVARYLVLLVAIAVVGAFLDRFPFGPTNNPISAGGRHTLWLVPAFAFGMAAVAHRVRQLTLKVDALRFGFDAAAVVAAVVIVVAGYQAAPEAPFQGSESATQFVDRSLEPDDAVIITSINAFSFAASTSAAVDLVATPSHQVGFAPVFRDPRIHVIGPWAVKPGTAADVRAWTRDANRVFVASSGPLISPGIAFASDVLTSEGFRKTKERQFLWNNTVDVWER